MTLREKMDRACLETLLELASVLPDRIDGVEALLHQRQESSAAGGAKSGGDASQNEAEMLAALGELILAVSHRLQRGKGDGASPPVRSRPPVACRSQSLVEESKHHSPRGGVAAGEGGQLAHPASDSGADSTKKEQPRSPEEDEVSSVSKVLNDHDLLIQIFAFGVGEVSSGGPQLLQARSCLGVLSVVGHRWRELALSERYWKPIALGAFPLLAVQPTSEQWSRWLEPRGGYRQFLLEYGRSTVQRRLTRLADWKEGLVLNFEVLDRMDGRHLYSAIGPIKVTAIADSNVTSLRLSGPLRQEVTSPFSAADRDPHHKRFGTIRDYFKSAHSNDFPAQLSVRITAFDERSGKMALLYEAVKCAKSSAGAQPSTYWQQFLPQGSLDVCDSWVWMQAGEDRPAMEMRVGFFVGPEPGQTGASDRDRRYRIVARDWHEHQQDASLTFLYFKSLDSLAIGRFIRDCLQ